MAELIVIDVAHVPQIDIKKTECPIPPMCKD
jgi:hypothetical protein